MRFVYVSRTFNRSGYYILERLIADRKDQIVAVILPLPKRRPWLDVPALAPLARAGYAAETWFYKCPPLRFMPSLKRLCDRHGVRLLEMRTLKTPAAIAEVARLAADLLVLGGGWPELLKPELLRLFPLGAVNTHPSLLPEFRGTDIHRWQVHEGVVESGVTIHYIDETFDTGAILGRAKVKIVESDTPQELFDKTARASAPLMNEVLRKIEAAAPGKVEGEPQEGRHDTSKYFSRWRWEDEEFLTLVWTRSSSQLARFVNACAQESYRYGGPHFSAQGRRFIVRRSIKAADGDAGPAGEVVRVDGSGVLVRCGETGTGRLLLKELQTDDKWRKWRRAQAADAWAKKYRIQPGDRLA
jgi:methionyl-tRNA formyltransferase